MHNRKLMVMVGVSASVLLGGLGTSFSQQTPVGVAAPKAQSEPLPHKLGTKHREAVSLMRQKKWDEAEKLTLEVKKGAPTYEPNLINMSIIYQQTGRVEDGIKLLREAMAVKGSSHHLDLRLATMLQSQKKRAEARQVLEEAARRYTDVPVVFVTLAQFYGDRDKALSVANYKTALVLEPGNRTALNNLAIIYMEEARYKDARRMLEVYRDKHPGGISGAFNLGTALYATGAFDEGIELHANLLKKRPGDPFALSGQGLGEVLAGKPEKARATVQPLLAGEKPHPLGLYTEGLALLFEGKAAEATPVLAKAHKLIPTRLQFAVAYAEALRQDGKLAKSKGVLQQISKSAANSQNQWGVYQALLKYSEGDFHQARQLRKESLALLPDYENPSDLVFLVRLPAAGIKDFEAIPDAKAKAAPETPATKPVTPGAAEGCGCAQVASGARGGPLGLLLLLGLLWGVRHRRQR